MFQVSNKDIRMAAEKYFLGYLYTSILDSLFFLFYLSLAFRLLGVQVNNCLLKVNYRNTRKWGWNKFKVGNKDIETT